MHVQLPSGARGLNYGMSFYLCPNLMCARSECSGETLHLRSCLCAFGACIRDRYQNVMNRFKVSLKKGALIS